MKNIAMRGKQAGIFRAGFLALMMAFTLPAHATEAQDGPKVKFNDPFIETLAGNWDVTRSIHGKTVKNKVSAEWVLDHHFLQIHMTDVAVPAAYEAIILLGYSNADHEYVVHWCDVYGARYSAIGKGKRVGDSIEFRFQYPDGPFFNTFSWNAKDQSWTMKMEGVDKDGNRQAFATDVFERAATL